MDPPGHTRLRKLVANAFTVRRVEALRPGVASIVDQLIDATAGEAQPTDLVAGFSLRLLVEVICADARRARCGWGSSTPGPDPIIGDWERDADEIDDGRGRTGRLSGKVDLGSSQPSPSTT